MIWEKTVVRDLLFAEDMRPILNLCLQKSREILCKSNIQYWICKDFMLQKM